MELVFASSNPHKLEEVRAIFAREGIRVLGLDDLEETPEEPEETGRTFEANARMKALYYASKTGRLTLADDSGLEVDALGGRPGVESARYAGVDGTRAERDAANNAKLRRELRDVPRDDRTARFVCAMALADSEGVVLAKTRETMEGVIVDEPRGRNGFGYDPLLELPDLGLTSAEISPEEKNARSHRGEAARRMAAYLKATLRAR